MTVSKVGQTAYYEPAKKATENKKETGSETNSSVTANVDTFEKGTAAAKSSSGVYSAASLQDAEKVRTESFVNMLKNMVVKQGQQSNLSMFGMNLYVTKEDSAAAAKSIADGGEYSVDAVATRIMDMAKALSGGDPAKIDKLRDAVTKGFKAAGVDLGGKLPDISNSTYNEIMKRFDDWQKESAA